MAGQDRRRDLHADQGSGAQRRPLAATNPGAPRRRPAGRLGVDARLRTRAASRHAKAIGRTYRSVAEQRTGVSELNLGPAQAWTRLGAHFGTAALRMASVS